MKKNEEMAAKSETIKGMKRLLATFPSLGSNERTNYYVKDINLVRQLTSLSYPQGVSAIIKYLFKLVVVYHRIFCCSTLLMTKLEVCGWVLS